MTPEPPGAIVAYRITHEKPGRTILFREYHTARRGIAAASFMVASAGMG
jgi:hypothetical protein